MHGLSQQLFGAAPCTTLWVATPGAPCVFPVMVYSTQHPLPVLDVRVDASAVVVGDHASKLTPFDASDASSVGSENGDSDASDGGGSRHGAAMDCACHGRCGSLCGVCTCVRCTRRNGTTWRAGRRKWLTQLTVKSSKFAVGEYEDAAVAGAAFNFACHVLEEFGVSVKLARNPPWAIVPLSVRFWVAAKHGSMWLL